MQVVLTFVINKLSEVLSKMHTEYNISPGDFS